ncbi:hypothetical protein [Sneathiella sp.]|uniref:hypothetical protein n=1 Tax=Sneathiella sp. TaxID=1964365 RepID=UPI002FE0C7DB
MTLPYQNTTSGERAVTEIQKILRSMGCNKFGVMTDDAEKTVTIQFEYRAIPVSVKASAKGYAAAWLKENPHTYRHKLTEAGHRRKAMEIAETAIYSILRDWIKAQVTLIECGIMSFEGAFLSNIMLPNGQTILEVAQDKKLLPAPAV